jgi:hypothetical protein
VEVAFSIFYSSKVHQRHGVARAQTSAQVFASQMPPDRIADGMGDPRRTPHLLPVGITNRRTAMIFI